MLTMNMFLRFNFQLVVTRTRHRLLTIAGASTINRNITSFKRIITTFVDSCTMLPTFGDRVFSPIDKRCISSKKNGLMQPLSQLDDAQTAEEEEYEDAIKTLNTLQSNAESIRQSIALNIKQASLDDMYKYLNRSGLNLDELEKLSFIHVSGTKGKGSTCALIESILRSYGARTGFFSSPHLVSVQERIRINGEPISKSKFINCFWHLYKRLQETKEHGTDMPSYFKFLTLMCFDIFLKEEVDVIILEVGIGGELDCTNVIRNTELVGITSLGLEHTQLLGNTLEEIARQKAGIIKPNARVYTSVTQPICLEVIRKSAAEKHATMYIVPNYSEYFNDYKTKIVLENLNNVTQLNASLAVQLSYDWLRNHKNGLHQKFVPNSTHLTDKVLEALADCCWPGRCQMIRLKHFNIHLDGAHTVESMSVCSDWFAKVAKDQHIPKVLIFNTTGERDPKKLLSILRLKNHFNLVCFVPNIAFGNANNMDNTSVYCIADQLARAKMHGDSWRLLCEQNNEPNSASILGSILDAFKLINKCYGSKKDVDVLVTGSLHLIGATVLALNKFSSHLDHT